MTELTDVSPSVGHIPGAGIDFATVGFVRVIDADQIGPSLPRSAMPGIRLAAPERLHAVTIAEVAVGDLVVTMTESARGVRLGRPMQVRHAGTDGTAVVLNDRSLPRSTRVDLSLSSPIAFGEIATAWHVLAAFGIGRCPRCHSPGQHLIYGLFVGEPSAAYVTAGCCVPWLAANFHCPRCHAEWPSAAMHDMFDPNYD